MQPAIATPWYAGYDDLQLKRQSTGARVTCSPAVGWGEIRPLETSDGLHAGAVQVVAPEPAQAVTSNVVVVMGADGPRVEGLNVEAAGASACAVAMCAASNEHLAFKQEFPNVACDALANAKRRFGSPAEPFATGPRLR